MGHWARRALGVATVTCALVAVPATLLSTASAAPGQPPTITLQAQFRHLRVGNPDTLLGQVTNAPTGSMVKVYSRPFPYKVARLIATLTPSPTGTFSVPVKPRINTQYGAIITNTTTHATTAIGVLYPLALRVKALPLGRAGITIVVHHPSKLHWGDALAKWYFKTPTHRHFYEASPGHTRKLSPTAVELRYVIELPAGKFRWRVCFHAPGDQAIVNARRPPGCTGRGYYGKGSLPVGYPGPAAISRASSYEAGRIGTTAFAVVDSQGRESGRNVHTKFQSASVVKAMLLVAYLRLKQARGQHTITSYDRSILNPMIEVSDNNAATRCWQIVGDGRLYALARAAHMKDFSIIGIWANAMLSAWDQALYFFEMDSLIPHEFVGYARYLLSHIASYESWGIPSIARPRGYQVYFKGGWIPPYLVHQAARLEGHDKRFSIAIMTINDPSFTYGIDTIQGVASRLLGG